MKVVRLKKGYRIHLTDREYNALGMMQTLGEAYIEGMDEIERDETIDEMGQRAYRRVVEEPWNVEDRR